MKNIILSTDGTGNAGGIGNSTNVWCLHKALDRNSHLTNKNHIRQIAYYHDGVGSQDSKWLKIMGGAFGYGLKRTIKELYIFLVNNYEPGDQIYLFGFSRGAYTVRLLAGMILDQGILRKSQYNNRSDEDLENDISQIYKNLRTSIAKNKENKLEKTKAFSEKMKRTRKAFRDLPSKINRLKELPEDTDPHKDIQIKFIGVWDTVDAYAIPSDTLANLFDYFFDTSFRESDNELGVSVENACHALSIDDERRTFEPVLWSENIDNNDHQRIKQVWFSGVHANVGGGYPKQGMAWITLEWMMLHAKRADLRFVKEDINQYTENKDVSDKLYDSRSGLGAYYLYKQRNIAQLWDRYTSKTSKPQIHISVFERIATRAEGFAPSNIPDDFEIVITKPLCSEHEEVENQADNFCSQYLPNDIETLQKQVSEALKEQSNQPVAILSGLGKGIQFVHHWSSYFLFFGTLFIWITGFFLFEINVDNFLIATFISIFYWVLIWQSTLKYGVRTHTKDSAFWRKVSSGKAWDFLRK